MGSPTNHAFLAGKGLQRTTISERVDKSMNLIVPTETDSVDQLLAARRSWVLRGVIRGFSEEARTRGFPSPSLGGFGFVVVFI